MLVSYGSDAQKQKCDRAHIALAVLEPMYYLDDLTMATAHRRNVSTETSLEVCLHFSR